MFLVPALTWLSTQDRTGHAPDYQDQNLDGEPGSVVGCLLKDRGCMRATAP